MKITDVTCALIQRGGEVLVTQRGPSMDLAYLWEFPGGKVQPGESERDCLIREIREELQLEVEPFHRLPAVTHDYGSKVIRLIPFVCRLSGGEIMLLEHNAYDWVDPQELPQLTWCPADIPVIASYLEWRKRI
jgi:8-oxo-dGTP diphosphatase